MRPISAARRARMSLRVASLGIGEDRERYHSAGVKPGSGSGPRAGPAISRSATAGSSARDLRVIRESAGIARLAVHPEISSLIYDWNAPEPRAPQRPVALLDDTLRDGLQSTGVRQPTLDERSELLGAMRRAGIDAVNLGLPGVSPVAASAIVR